MEKDEGFEKFVALATSTNLEALGKKVLKALDSKDDARPLRERLVSVVVEHKKEEADLDGGVPLSKDDQARSDKLDEEYKEAKKRGQEFDELLEVEKKKKPKVKDPCVVVGCSNQRKTCASCHDRFVNMFCDTHTGHEKCMTCQTELYDCSKCGDACEEDFITTFQKVKPFQVSIDGKEFHSVNKMEVSFRLCDDCISS